MCSGAKITWSTGAVEGGGGGGGDSLDSNHSIRPIVVPFSRRETKRDWTNDCTLGRIKATIIIFNVSERGLKQRATLWAPLWAAEGRKER